MALRSREPGSGIRIAVTRPMAIALGLAVIALVSCGKSFAPEPIESGSFLNRAQTQRYGSVTVRTAVPSPEEAAAVLGIPVYDRGIQPVWLEVTNESEDHIRFAPVGTDRRYFSPMEVPYLHKQMFSKQTLAQVERRFYETAMPRIVPAGRSASGFVYTHLEAGTKAFNVELFSPRGSFARFTFFVDVPGFVPDHAEVDFDALYDESEIRRVSLPELREALVGMPCCATDVAGDRGGIPVNVVLVGDGFDVLHALLRAGWRETERPKDAKSLARVQHLYGRPPDAVFRLKRARTGERNELRVWMSPFLLDGVEVWLAQMVHYIGRATELERAFFDPRLDPDVDDSRYYMLQKMWYSQGLEAFTHVSTGEAVPIDDLRQSFEGSSHFTDGYRAVLWLTGTPVSLIETRDVGWDEPPGR